MGGLHAGILQTEVANARLAAVADLDRERAGKVAERSGTDVFGDAVAMIRDENVDAVVIASPDPTHAPLVKECLSLGKPVLCEKPLADSAEAALEVVEAEVELGRKLVQVGFMRRYDPQHVAAKEAVEAGSVGAPVVFKGWHRNADLDPGIDSEWVVINAMIHDIDSARWFIEEEIEEVYVRGKNTEAKVVAHYGYEVGVEVVCERGVVRTEMPSGAVVRQDRAASRVVTEGWYDRFRTAYETEVKGWVESVVTGVPSGSDAWDGYASLVVADACIASLRSGMPQKVAR